MSRLAPETNLVTFKTGSAEWQAGYDAGYDGKPFRPTSPTWVDGFERGAWLRKNLRLGTA